MLSGAPTSSLRKAMPIIDVRDPHVVETSGNSIHFGVTHDGHVNNLRDFVSQNPKIWLILLVFSARKRLHLPGPWLIVQITPDEFAQKRRGD